MPNNWTVQYVDFLVFAESWTYKPAYASTVDSLSFSDGLTTNRIEVVFSDGITSWKDGFNIGASIHHVGLNDALAFADGMMKGSPQSLVDRMILIDELDRATNLLHDSLAFTDGMTGVDTKGLPDTLVLSDTFSLNFIWGHNTGGVGDSFALSDYMNYLYSPDGPIPNPWIPNYPTTQFNSLNTCCGYLPSVHTAFAQDTGLTFSEALTATGTTKFIAEHLTFTDTIQRSYFPLSDTLTVSDFMAYAYRPGSGPGPSPLPGP